LSGRAHLGMGAALLAVLAFAVGCGDDEDSGDGGGEAASGETIKVGLNLEQSGPGSFFGQSRIFGATAAINKVNEDGGIKVGDKTYELEAVLCDNRTEATYGVRCAQEAVDEGVLWTTTPDIGFEGAYQIFRENGILALGNGGVASAMLMEEPENHPLLAFEFLTYHQLVESHYSDLRAMFPDAKTVAGLIPDDANGRTYGEAFEEYAPDHGFEYVKQELHPPDATGDFTSYLTSLKAANPDVIWLGYYPQVVAAAAEQAAQLDAADVLMTEGLTTDDVKGVNHDGYPLLSAHGAYAWGEGFMPEDPETREAVDAIDAEAGGEAYIPSIATMGYVGEIMAVVEAIEQAGTLEPEKIAEELKTAKYDGPLGPATGLDNRAIDLAQTSLLFSPDGTTMDVFQFDAGSSTEPSETFEDVPTGG
jgi:branched-chain amino acid transport system substrate-binding protein